MDKTTFLKFRDTKGCHDISLLCYVMLFTNEISLRSDCSAQTEQNRNTLLREEQSDHGLCSL